MDKHILVFGTSTTYGAWDMEGGWVQRLRKYFDQKNLDSTKEITLVYNLGVSGDKSGDILKRFEEETKARLGHDEDNEIIILFHLGINDCIYNASLGGLEISPDQFRQNYNRLISLAKKYSQKIIIIGSMPVDKRVDPMPWSSGRSYRNEYFSQFNKIMKEVAEGNDAPFIEIYHQFINKDYSGLLADGVHMTTVGHKNFFEIVKNYLLENKII